MSDIFDTAKLVKSLEAASFSITRFVYAGSGIAHQEDLGVRREDQDYLVDEIVRVEEELGLPVRVLTPIPLCALQHPEKIAGRMSKCDGGITWCGISPMGEVRTCTNIGEIAGDLKSQTLEEIWQQGESFRRNRGLQHIPPECMVCKAFFMCGGGCRACAFNYSHGQYQACDPCSNVQQASALAEKLPEIVHEVVQRKMADGRKELVDNIEKSIPDLFPYIFGTLNVRQEEFGLLASVGRNYAVVNENGVEILQQCTGENSLAEIIDYFVEKYKQPKEDISKGVVSFTKNVTLLGLLNWRHAESGGEEVAATQA